MSFKCTLMDSDPNYSIFLEQLKLILSYAYTFKAEILVIKIAVGWIRYQNILCTDKLILPNDKAAIKSPGYVFITSMNTQEYRVSLEEISRHSTDIVGHYNPSFRIIDLVSHTTYVVCVNFIHKWWDIQFKVDSEWQIF